MPDDKPGNRIGRNIPAGYVTATGLAKRLNVSPRTVKRWQASGKEVPTKIHIAGKLKVALYSDADVAAMRARRNNNTRRKTK